MSSPSSFSGTKSAMRVMEILEYFDRERRPLSLKEVVAALSYPASSALALLKSLVHAGYLEFDKKSHTYLPTMKIAVLGDWVPEGLFSRMNIVPIMERLRDLSGETVFLGTRSDLYTQYVHVANAAAPDAYFIPPGALRPLARSGIGHLFLSLLSPADLEYTVRRLNAGEPNRELHADLKDVARSAQTIRRQGYVFTTGLFHKNAGVVAVVLPVAPFNRTFALGVGGPSKRLAANLQTILGFLGEAVEDVRRAAAAFAPPPPS